MSGMMRVLFRHDCGHLHSVTKYRMLAPAGFAVLTAAAIADGILQHHPRTMLTSRRHKCYRSVTF